MAHKRAFLLSDVLMATFISLLMSSAILTITCNTKNAAFKHYERQVAWEILEHHKHLPTSWLDNIDERHYDYRGMPTLQANKYLVRVTTEHEDHMRLFLTEVLWTGKDGTDHELAFERWEWMR